MYQLYANSDRQVNRRTCYTISTAMCSIAQFCIHSKDQLQKVFLWINNFGDNFHVFKKYNKRKRQIKVYTSLFQQLAFTCSFSVLQNMKFLVLCTILTRFRTNITTPHINYQLVRSWFSFCISISKLRSQWQKFNTDQNPNDKLLSPSLLELLGISSFNLETHHQPQIWTTSTLQLQCHVSKEAGSV